MAMFSRYLQRTRTQRVVPWIRGSVLDLGCADAPILEHVQKRIESYCGVELSADFVQSLQERYPSHTFLRRDMDEDQIGIDRRFDTVLMTAFIEHIYNQKHLFREILLHLKPGGRIVITTPTPLGDLVHRWGTKLRLFAKSARDHHPVIFNKERFYVFARYFSLDIEAYSRFQFGCNQLVVLRRRHDSLHESTPT